ncbi:flagellar filament capping protein FliD [Petroclostridium xylanilyticum]|uniref:flagellar filament capping protein FliD n=1 Tax=Petroclostridium xylanilyticum TaxID=1792311 RepID=UPI000B993FAA|nr:flagellar filament capping protein FliD [Petroclostridium xylanilyticum]
MASSISSVYNTTLRLTGLSSGIDTESIIKQLMQIEQMKVDKVKQEKQLLEWKKEDYRSITNLLRSFKDEYFDILKPETNMRSQSAYAKYDETSSDPDVATAIGGAGVISTSHTLTVSEIAEAAKAESSAAVSGGANGTISLNDTLETVSAKLTAGSITFGGANNDELTLTINGVTITAKKNETLNTLINRVNSSNAGVKMSYSPFLDKFTINAKETGLSGNNITVTDNGSGFVSATRLNLVDNKLTGGKDASFTLDGKTSTSKSNTFTIDGVTYTLKGKTGASTTITLEQDTDGIYNLIKGFVDKYNEIISTINNEYNEKRNRDYPPLTDAQKEEMTENDIKLWEEKAKAGMLYRDSILGNITNDMRRAMYDSIYTTSGDSNTKLSYNLASIGITTGSYQDMGKLIIDENKLKEAIKNSPEQVIQLFTQESDVAYSPDLTAVQRKERYEENGIIYRLYDIIENNIRTTRDSSGKKGILLEKAGIAGDLTDTNNLMNTAIAEKDSLIDTLLVKLQEKEERYYQKFAAMEEALSRMNSQSAWISQQMG